MEQRRKIVIPTSTEPIEEPHFDTEAALSARPVVPLTESVAVDSYDKGAQPAAVTSVASVARRSPWVLVLLIAAAALAGAAGALAIDYLRNPQHKEAEVTTTTTAQPSSSMNAVAQPVAKPTEELKSLDEVGQAAPQPVVKSDDEKAAEKTEPARASTVGEVEKKKPEPQPKASVPAPKEESSRKESKETAKSAKPRDKSDDERADDEREQRRQQRREQRRARIVDEYNPDDLPAGGRRRKEGVTRIRDIFEGTRP